jgi:hypothetical protein
VARLGAVLAIALCACGPSGTVLVPVPLPNTNAASVIGFRHGSGPMIDARSADLTPDLTLRFDGARDGDRIDLLFYAQSLYELGSVPVGQLTSGTGAMSATLQQPLAAFFGAVEGTRFSDWTPESKDQLPAEVIDFRYALTGTASPHCPTFQVTPLVVPDPVGIFALAPFGPDSVLSLPSEDLANVYLVDRSGSHAFFRRTGGFDVRALFLPTASNDVWAGLHNGSLAKFPRTATTATTAISSPFVGDEIAAMDGAPDASEILVLTVGGRIGRFEPSGWTVIGALTSSLTGNLDFGHAGVTWIGHHHEVVVDNSDTVRIVRDTQIFSSQPLGPTAGGTHLTAVVRTGTSGYVLGGTDGSRLEFFDLDPVRDIWRPIPGTTSEMTVKMRTMTGVASGVVWVDRQGAGGYTDTKHGIACPGPAMSLPSYGGAVNDAVTLTDGDIVFGGDTQRDGNATPFYFLKLLF